MGGRDEQKTFKSIREYKKESFLTPVLVCLEVLMEVLIPLLMARIIDVGIMEGDMAYIIKMGLLLILMAMLAWYSVQRPVSLARLLHQVTRRICVMTFFIKFRIFRLEISIILNIKPCDKNDNRYYECAERLSDVYPNRDKGAADAGFSMVMCFWINRTLSLIFWSRSVFWPLCCSFSWEGLESVPSGI